MSGPRLILFLILVNAACVGCEPLVQPLTMPREPFVGEVGRAGGLPLTASVPSGLHVGDQVTLHLKVTNLLDHPCLDPLEGNSRYSQSFTFWLQREGCEVPLTRLGSQSLERQTTIFEIGGGVPLQPSDYHLASGASSSRLIDLTQLFQIKDPGKYTVIAEHAAVWDEDSPARELNAVKTSFVILP